MTIKTTRATETRDQDTVNNKNREIERRENDLHQVYNMDHVGLFDLPDCVFKPGYKYGYFTYRVFDEPTDRVEMFLRQKWSMVPSSRLPNSVNYDPLGRNPLSKQYIFARDLVLMERPDIFTEKQNKDFEEYNQKLNKNLLGVTKDRDVKEVRAM